METFEHYVAQVTATIAQLTVTEAAAVSPANVLFIDTREPAEWQDGIIAGAICCPRGLLESRIIQLISVHCGGTSNITQPADTPAQEASSATAYPVKRPIIILYCRSGARSALAAQSLQQMKIPLVYSLAGGYKKWCETGLPVAQYTP